MTYMLRAVIAGGGVLEAVARELPHADLAPGPGPDSGRTEPAVCQCPQFDGAAAAAALGLARPAACRAAST